MSTELLTTSRVAVKLPVARRALSVRLATNDDIPFMDEMQKLHQKQLGFMPRQTFEGKIRLGHVLVAEGSGEKLGYCISQDKYMGHEDVGIFYQVNVKPVAHRSLIGASLVKA